MTTPAQAREPCVGRWQAARLGCWLPLLFLACILYEIAAVRPAIADSLARTHRGGLVVWTKDLSYAGVNVPLALFGLYLLFEFGR